MSYKDFEGWRLVVINGLWHYVNSGDRKILARDVSPNNVYQQLHRYEQGTASAVIVFKELHEALADAAFKLGVSNIAMCDA